MSVTWAPIEVHFKDGRFIMERSTIQKFPESLLNQKLNSLGDSSNIIEFDREVGMFKLIKQLMIYKGKVRSADVRSVNEGQLEDELEFFKLMDLSIFVKSVFPRKSVSKACNLFCVTEKIENHSDTAWPIKEPTLVIRINTKRLDRLDLSLISSNKEYKIWEVLEVSRLYCLRMDYYVRPKEDPCLSLNVDWTDESQALGWAYLFLVAVDRYNTEKGLLIGRKMFEKVMGRRLEVKDPEA